MRSPRRTLIAAALGLCLVVPMAVVSTVSAAATVQGHHQGDLGPEVMHTGQAPTGYEVTFRFYAPHATRVQIKGEWYFENPFTLPHIAPTPGHPIQTPGLLPSQWQPGDVPIQSPNSAGGNWPVADMKKSGDGGVWTYTTPLPSGIFSYSFYVDCHTSNQSGCTELADPANPSWATKAGVVDASSITLSTIYVPSDPRFGTVNYTWQAPAAGPHGKLAHFTYDAPGHVNPTNKNYLVVYTPPGYNPHRAKLYPTLYLNHGGGGNELDWTNQGAVANIMDNLIDTGEVQPMVVVLPNGNGWPDTPTYVGFRADLINNIIPWVQAHYHVSTSASGRAYSGLSQGGMLTNQLLLHNTGMFGYYGMMSAGLPPGTTITGALQAAIKKTAVFVGAGWQDVIFADGFSIGGTVVHTGPAKEVRILANAQIPVTPDFVDGGHEWYVWRLLLKDFLTRVAFWPSSAATW